MPTISQSTKRLFAVYLVWTVATLVLHFFAPDMRYLYLVWNMLLALIPLILSTAIGVLVGSALNRFISPRALRLAGGALFIAFGLFMLCEGLVSEKFSK